MKEMLCREKEREREISCVPDKKEIRNSSFLFLAIDRCKRSKKFAFFGIHFLFDPWISYPMLNFISPSERERRNPRDSRL